MEVHHKVFILLIELTGSIISDFLSLNVYSIFLIILSTLTGDCILLERGILAYTNSVFKNISLYNSISLINCLNSLSNKS